MKKLNFDIILDNTSKPAECPREKTLRQIFGIGHASQQRILHKGIELPMNGITYITGYSGAGKSCLLQKVATSLPHATTSTPKPAEDLSVLNCFNTSVEETICWLSHFGLGEAQLLLTPVKNLSIGQRERLHLALLLWSRPSIAIIDEFLAPLDRLTARIISFQFQKLARRLGITCYVATAHSDLEDALFPDTLIHLDFEGIHTITERSTENRMLPEISKIEIGDGTVSDYRELSRFHYMDSQVGDDFIDERNVVKIRTATYKGMLVGVRVFSKLYPASYERIRIFKWINDRALLSSRVVVHPAFRGLGISKMMDIPFQPNSKFRAIFTHSALARYFPFDVKNGYKTTVHSSEFKSRHHQDFETILSNMGIQNPEQLNEIKVAQSFWKAMTNENRAKLREVLTSLLVDYDMRYFRYIISELNVMPPENGTRSLKRFFHQRVSAIPDNEFWKLLSEGLYFPMQGLVRHQSSTERQNQQQ